MIATRMRFIIVTANVIKQNVKNNFEMVCILITPEGESTRDS